MVLVSVAVRSVATVEAVVTMAVGDRTKARLVNGYSDAVAPGDFYFYSTEEAITPAGMHHVCPRCGELGGMRFTGPKAWTWNGDRKAPTCWPSILHDSARCGWHGFLTEGDFIEV